MKDLTETNYFDKPEDKTLVRYLPHVLVVGFVILATGFFYTNLMFKDKTPGSSAEEKYIPPTEVVSPTPTTIPPSS